MAIPHSPTTPRNTVAHNSGSQSRIKRAILESTDDVGGRKQPEIYNYECPVKNHAANAITTGNNYKNTKLFYD